MKDSVKTSLIFASLISLSTSAYSQGTGQPLSGLTDPSIQRREQDRRNETDLDRRMKMMDDLERASIRRSQGIKDPAAPEPTIDKATKERVMLQRRIKASDAAPYAELLKSDTAGIVKIFPWMNCATATVIRVDEECSAYVPMSSDFSFRQRAYIDHSYEDIGFNEGVFSNRSFFTQAGFIELGDTPLDQKLVNDQRVAVLSKVADKDATIDDARVTASRLKATFQIDGVQVSWQVTPSVGNTYALRVIAYRFAGSVPPPTSGSSTTELRFLSLNADKRDDLTVAFRVLSKDENGGLTIVWKELRRTDAPKLKLTKGQPLSDFRML